MTNQAKEFPMKNDFFRFRNLLSGVLVAGAFATLALAHNKLIKTEPADGAMLKTAPAHIELWFAEKPDPALSKISLKGPNGAIETGATRGTDKSLISDVKSKLADGKYTVNWQTSGDDGHVSKGEFSFGVQAH
jgi:methionine-rich copper-binding protein CopC